MLLALPLALVGCKKLGSGEVKRATDATAEQFNKMRCEAIADNCKFDNPRDGTGGVKFLDVPLDLNREFPLKCNSTGLSAGASVEFRTATEHEAVNAKIEGSTLTVSTNRPENKFADGVTVAGEYAARKIPRQQAIPVDVEATIVGVPPIKNCKLASLTRPLKFDSPTQALADQILDGVPPAVARSKMGLPPATGYEGVVVRESGPMAVICQSGHCPAMPAAN